MLRRQGGFVMVIALVALAILSLAAIGLIRTVATSSSIAGNLAFEQAATTSADQAFESAITWLENNAGQASSASATACAAEVGATVLACDQASRGYASQRTDPSSSQSWSAWWTQRVAAGYTAVALDADTAGNSAAYLIERMCTSSGDASASIGCSAPPSSQDSTSSKKAGSTAQSASSQVYFRITVKVAGPRNTLSFTQAMVAL